MNPSLPRIHINSELPGTCEWRQGTCEWSKNLEGWGKWRPMIHLRKAAEADVCGIISKRASRTNTADLCCSFYFVFLLKYKFSDVSVKLKILKYWQHGVLNSIYLPDVFSLLGILVRRYASRYGTMVECIKTSRI